MNGLRIEFEGTTFFVNNGDELRLSNPEKLSIKLNCVDGGILITCSPPTPSSLGLPIEKNETKKCVCAINDLMAKGCQCGSMQNGRS